MAADQKYTVRDNNDVLETQSAIGLHDPTLAFGLSSLSDWSTQMPFVDLIKTSRPWFGNVNNFGGKTNGDLTKAGVFDENGWATHIPDDLRSIGTIWVWDTGSSAAEQRKGTYVLRYEGDGEISINGGVNNVVHGENEITFNNHSGGTFWVNISETDPNGSGDYIKNMSLVKEENIELFEAGVTFNPDWIELIQDSRQLRFLDWMGANSSGQSDWAKRAEVSYNNWALKKAPVEIMVELANLIGSDPWFTIPHLADDEYIREFAEYVESHLDPRLKAHVEYSNEAWNYSFGQTHYFLEKATVEWGTQDPSQYYVKRATEVMKIWDDVFGQDSESRIVKILGGQTSNIHLTNRLLNPATWFINEPDEAIDPGEVFDALAVTTYFGSADVTKSHLRQNLLAAINDPEVNATQYLADKLSDPDHPQSIPNVIAALRQQKDLAAAKGLKLISYEGGQHVHHSFSVNDLTHEEEIQLRAFLADFVRSDEMAELYQDLWSAWKEVGDGPFMQFQDVSASGKSGSWGTYESLNDGNPRSDALEILNQTEARWWEEDRGTNTFLQGLSITGTDAGDDLIGSAEEDLLLGGEGDDTLFGGAGNDSLHGGIGWDIAEYNGPQSEYQVEDFGSFQIVEGPDGKDRLVSIEELRFAPEEVKPLTISSIGLHIIEQEEQTLDASISFNGRAAIVAINRYSKTGKELALMGTEPAYAVYKLSSGARFDGKFVKPNYWSVQENKASAKGLPLTESAVTTALSLSSILEISGGIGGTEFGDVFRGRHHDDHFFGASGGDYVVGGGGDDSIEGERGNDNLFGGRGNDIIKGGNGKDKIVGGRGDDEINGGAWNDLLQGRGGNDTFVFEDGFGKDTITDFRSGEDQISFENHSSVASFRDLSITQVGATLVVADGNGNSIKLLHVHESDIAATDFVF